MRACNGGQLSAEGGEGGAYGLPVVFVEDRRAGEDDVGPIAEGVQGLEARGDFRGDVVDGGEVLDLNGVLVMVLVLSFLISRETRIFSKMEFAIGKWETYRILHANRRLEADIFLLRSVEQNMPRLLRIDTEDCQRIGDAESVAQLVHSFLGYLGADVEGYGFIVEDRNFFSPESLRFDGIIRRVERYPKLYHGLRFPCQLCCQNFAIVPQSAEAEVGVRRERESRNYATIALHPLPVLFITWCVRIRNPQIDLDLRQPRELPQRNKIPLAFHLSLQGRQSRNLLRKRELAIEFQAAVPDLALLKFHAATALERIDHDCFHSPWVRR